MSFFTKMRPGQEPAMPQRPSPQGNARPRSAVAIATAGNSQGSTGADPKGGRQSNGLKEFLVQLDGIGRGHLLDFGPARQSTLNFFIERGFKVYTEDLLATWQYFLEEQAQQLKQLTADADRSDFSMEGRAEKFLKTTMQFPDDTFDAILMWDNLDYLDTELMTRLATRITALLRDGGVVFAMFHTKKPAQFHRYKVLDAQNLELIPANCAFQPQRVFQNREISNLFSRYRSSKMFVGRDQIREGLFVK